MNKKILVIIDMQIDFISGSLASPDAEKIVEPICEYITNEEWDEIILTRDTHDSDYLSTPEGKKLPIEHTINQTAGWCVDDRIQKALRGKKYSYINKSQFGTFEWLNPYYDSYNKETVTACLVGTRTEICVLSNALIMRPAWPKANIQVKEDLCAGSTPEQHKAAIEVMRSCQINII